MNLSPSVALPNLFSGAGGALRRVLSLMLVALLFNVSGCSKSNGADAVQAQAAAGSGVGALSDSAKLELLQGFWSIDGEATADHRNAEGPGLFDRVDDLVVSRYFVGGNAFDDQGGYQVSFSVMGDESRGSGKYKVFKVEGDSLTLEMIARDDAGNPTTLYKTATFVSRDTLRLAPVPGPGDTKEELLLLTDVFRRSSAEGIEAAMAEGANHPGFKEVVAGMHPAERAIELSPAQKQAFNGYWLSDVEDTVEFFSEERHDFARAYASAVRVGLGFDGEGEFVMVVGTNGEVLFDDAYYSVVDIHGDTFTLAVHPEYSEAVGFDQMVVFFRKPDQIMFFIVNEELEEDDVMYFILNPTTAEAINAAMDEEAARTARLHGAWIIDAEATVAQLPVDQQAMAAEFIRLMKIGMVFDAEGKLAMSVSMEGEQETQEGSYKILGVEGDVLLIEMKREEEDGAEEASLMLVTFLSPNKIVFAPVPEEGDTEEDIQRDTIILKRTTPSALKSQMNASN